MQATIYNASGDIVYTVSFDGVQKCKVANDELDVNVTNERIDANVTNDILYTNTNISSCDALVPVEVVSADASYNAIDYTEYLESISNDSSCLTIGLLLMFTFIIILKEVRGWR